MEKKPTTKRYPPELKERAVRMVLDLRGQDPHDKTVISRVARQLGIGDESLRAWVKRAEVDAGKRPGLTSEEQAELKRLRKENFELRRANEILKSASLFFAREPSDRGERVHRRAPRGLRGRADLSDLGRVGVCVLQPGDRRALTARGLRRAAAGGDQGHA